MVLGLYLTLDQDIIFDGNYSDVSGFRITGTIYSDKEKTTPFTLTGYTLTMNMYKNSFTDWFNQTCTITVAANGTFYIAVTSGMLPYPGLYNVAMTLTKSGSKVTTLNRQELLIQR